MNEREAELGVLHFGRRVLPIPFVERERALFAVAEREGKLARRDDRKPAGLIARVHISDVGDAVARHVVMVERLAELFGGKHGSLDGSTRCLLDVRSEE